MAFLGGLSLNFLPVEVPGQMPAQWWDEVLGVAVYGGASPTGWPQYVPSVQLAMPPLAGASVACEVWRAHGPLIDGTLGGIRYRRNESVIFGCIELSEGEFAGQDAAESPSGLHRATRSIYERLFMLLDEMRYPGLLRVWNYLPDINLEADGSERYWQFNAGRQDAFIQCGRTTGGNVPAACALGSATGPVALYFIAAREAPLAIENPRQISAYHYPERYGPRSPTFARAGLSRPHGSPLLFVSGTASIVGHETRHHGDAIAQTVESLRNIEAVLAEARRHSVDARFGLQDLAYKVYVRNPDEFEVVQSAFEAHLACDAPVLYLQADVCRSDLLVEVEASAGHEVEYAL